MKLRRTAVAQIAEAGRPAQGERINGLDFVQNADRNRCERSGLAARRHHGYARTRQCQNRGGDWRSGDGHVHALAVPRRRAAQFLGNRVRRTEQPFEQ